MSDAITLDLPPVPELPDWARQMLAAAHQASAAASDMIDAVRDGVVTPFDNVGSLDTLVLLVDAVRLLVLATGSDERDDDCGQLLAAVLKWQEAIG